MLQSTPIDLYKQTNHVFFLCRLFILNIMWSSLHPFLSLAAGIMSNLQEPFNISRGDVTELSGNQFSDFVPYIEFARAAYCTPNKIAGWQCGG
jgi:hypothetical protein